MPVLWKNKILLAKNEVTYGTDPVPTGAANAILAVDVALSPMEGEDVGRNLDLPYFGHQGTIAAAIHQKLSFKVELAPSGTAGTAPAWGPLLRACGMAQVITPGVSVAYNPITDSPESVTIYLWVGGTLFKLTGARGTCVLRVNAQGIPYLEFEFTGLYVAAAETARATPTLTAFQKPQIGSRANTPTFTVNAVPLILRQFALDIGNAVEGRFLIGTNAENIIITDRQSSIEALVEAVPLTTLNPFTLAQNSTNMAVQLVHGTGAGRVSTLAIPVAQLQRPAGIENSQNIAEWPLRFNATPSAGNDEFTLTLT